MNVLAELPPILQASLNATTRKDAEQKLKVLSTTPHFLPSLLQLVLASPTVDMSIRLTGAIYLKNVVRKNWIDVRG